MDVQPRLHSIKLHKIALSTISLKMKISIQMNKIFPFGVKTF